MARPKEYSRDEALKNAMLLFWEKGYDKTSMQDLTSAMGLSRSSIYDEFQNKEQLFLESLIQYSELKQHNREVLIKKYSDNPKQAIEWLLYALVDDLHNKENPDGCMLTETVSSITRIDDAIALYAKEQIELIYTMYYTLIKKARINNLVNSKLNNKELAEMLINFHEGLIVMAKVNRNKSEQREAIRIFMDMI